MFKKYDDVQAHLDRLGLFHMNFGLQRMYTALNKLGLLQPWCRVVHVLGTNGKGSTSTFLSAISRVHSLKTGLYTSPHFVSPTERIRIDGIPLSEECWADLGNRVMQAHKELTYFEFLTVLALLAFRESKTDIIIMEAGLGGAHDATTAMNADMLCYTPIDLDHTAILGKTLTAIAIDKAGAIRGTHPVISAPQQPEVLNVLRRECRLHQTSLTVVDDSALRLTSSMELGLSGPYQRINAALAYTAWSNLHTKYNIPFSMPAIRKGLCKAFIPGRLQMCRATSILPSLWLDGAHNEHGMRALLQALHEIGSRPSAVVFSCLKDKNWPVMCELLMRCVNSETPILIPEIQNERAASPENLKSMLNQNGACDVRTFPNVSAAVDELPLLHTGRAPVLMCGSLYLLSEFYAMHPSYLQNCQNEDSNK